MKTKLANAVFIIAEAGSNWKCGSPKEDLARALALIDIAAKAGADAVKFQTFRAQTVYVSNAGTSDYLSKHGIKRSIGDIFKDLSMPYAMIPKLAAYCRKKKIEFMSSFFSPDDFEAVNPHVRRHKIASYEITHPRLLYLAARSGKPLILSTGASTHDDIGRAIRYFKKNGGKKISLMQCTAKYPAPFSSLNLRAIPKLCLCYRVPVGLSDHSLDPIVAPVAAVALGASLIEKHFTLSQRLQGPDHAFAIEPHDLEKMVRSIRNCEQTLGDGLKRVLGEEKELHQYAQRGVQASRNICRGEVLRLGVNMAILRPGRQKKGMNPLIWLSKAEGKRVKRNIAIGEGIQRSDFLKG